MEVDCGESRSRHYHVGAASLEDLAKLLRHGQNAGGFGQRRRPNRPSRRMSWIDGDGQSLERTRERHTRWTAKPENETARRVEEHEIAVRGLRELERDANAVRRVGDPVDHSHERVVL